MGYRHRYMYNMTGLPGWMRFGFSPGWLGRSPTGLPPTAQWLMQSGLLPQYMQWLQSQAPQMVPPSAQPQVPPAGTPAPGPFGAPFAPAYSKEQEKQMLEQQIQMLESQLEAIRTRLEELSK
ncbi:MAG: DUF5320 domain-containing protein [Candidatus Thorarchaeota archaeon]|nr:MAG: DUF5320 domain-containing protein [Candidatus Thorarchaeota archaeon]